MAETKSNGVSAKKPRVRLYHEHLVLVSSRQLLSVNARNSVCIDPTPFPPTDFDRLYMYICIYCQQPKTGDGNDLWV